MRSTNLVLFFCCLFSMANGLGFLLAKISNIKVTHCETGNPCPKNLKCHQKVCLASPTEMINNVGMDINAFNRIAYSYIMSQMQGTEEENHRLPLLRKLCQSHRLIASERFEEGYVFSTYETDKYFVIAFKGMSTWQEFKDNLKASQVECNLVNECGQIHNGFSQIFETIKDRLDSSLLEIKAKRREEFYQKKPQRKLVLVGHSLGGALATLTAVYVAATHPGMLKQVITIGSPRVGDNDFANAFKRLVIEKERAQAYRYFLADRSAQDLNLQKEIKIDPIANLPRIKGGYRHVTEGYALETKGLSTFDLHVFDMNLPLVLIGSWSGQPDKACAKIPDE